MRYDDSKSKSLDKCTISSYQIMENKKEVTSPIYFEEWKFVDLPKVVKNYYEVSTFGRVRNNKGKILNQITINSGYKEVRLFKDKEHRYSEPNRYLGKTVHRLVMETFAPTENQEELTVNHMSGDKFDNSFYNLEWMTQADNNRHSYETGLNDSLGEKRYNAVLTNDIVREICQILESGQYSNYREILTRVGMEVTPNNMDLVGNIKRRICWNWISKDYTW